MQFRDRILLATAAFTVAGWSSAFAQSSTAETPAADAASSVELEEVVVSGYRKSLLDATESKRQSVAFTDTISASEMGKFPDVNLSESLQRIPGVNLSRNGYTGEGVTVSVRGLGPSFTSFTLNGAPFQVASNGDGFVAETNREVDLNLFPSELFTKLAVSKTPVASQVEGGVAGNVNLRTARPFDNQGLQLNYNAFGNYNQISGKIAPRAAIVASNTWDTFGVLVGYSYLKQDLRTDFYVPQDMTDVNLSRLTADPQGPVAAPVNGSNGYLYPTTIPTSYNGIQGLVGGAPVTLALLQSLNPGLSVDQLKGALLPRLGTVQFSKINSDRHTGVVSFEFRPRDDLHFALDLMGGSAKKTNYTSFLAFTVRNSNTMIPINQQVDANNVVTSGTYVGATHFFGTSDVKTDTWFFNVNPEMNWDISDKWSLVTKVDYSKSAYHEKNPSLLTMLDLGKTATDPTAVDTVTYTNNGGVPSMQSSQNLNSTNLPWDWFAARVQKVKRETQNYGAHVDLKWVDGSQTVLFGAADDHNERTISTYNNDSAWTNFVNSAGSPVPKSALSNYMKSINLDNFMSLIPGNNVNNNFVAPDIRALEPLINYQSFIDSAPLVAGSGTFTEKTLGGYVEYLRTFPIFGRDATIDVGLRHVSTDQFVSGAGTVNGAIRFTQFSTDYSADLPSFNAIYKAADNVILRLAASKTMTRANPNDLLPTLTFNDPGASQATKGNENLKPYFSKNLDFGGEYYTGGLGYVGFNVFHKRITNFTQPSTLGVHLADLGLTMSDITVQQQNAINLQGGPNVASIQLSTTINSPTPVTFKGFELNWVQPLDILVKGTGFSANYTNLTTSASQASLIPTNVPHYTYNVVGYYENNAFSVHVSYNYSAGVKVFNPPQRNTNLAIFQEGRGQLDLSASYKLDAFKIKGELSLEATNITKEAFKQYFAYTNAADQTFNPGMNIMLGWRGRF